MKIKISVFFILIFCIISPNQVSAQLAANTLSTRDAMNILRKEKLIFVLPSNEYKINEAQKLIDQGNLSNKSRKRLIKMINSATKEQATLIRAYTSIGRDIYNVGEIHFILDTALVAFQKEPHHKYYLGDYSNGMKNFEISSYIICYPTLSLEQSLEVFSFKGSHDEQIERPFPKYIRRKNGFDNFRHIIFQKPTIEFEVKRVFKAINKALSRI